MQFGKSSLQTNSDGIMIVVYVGFLLLQFPLREYIKTSASPVLVKCIRTLDFTLNALHGTQVKKVGYKSTHSDYSFLHTGKKANEMLDQPK